jgi:hypothetical protein
MKRADPATSYIHSDKVNTVNFIHCFCGCHHLDQRADYDYRWEGSSGSEEEEEEE